MAEHWVIPVEAGDPLGAACSVLQAVWEAADLERMLIPIWSEEAHMPLPTIIREFGALTTADPFAPIMPGNAAGLAARTIQGSPGGRTGLFLRPCEVRSLRQIAAREQLPLDDVLLVSSDCLGAIPAEDYRRHLTLTKDYLQMTRETLQFAAQGGVLPSRYQQSCQLCDAPYPERVDLHFELFGSETHDRLLVKCGHDRLRPSLAERVECRPAPVELLERRQRVIENLGRWRTRSLDNHRMEIDPELASPAALFEHLEHCSACWDTLEAHCPTFDAQILLAPDGQDALLAWLGSCGGCGMCHSTCPEGYPLFEVIAALRSSTPANDPASQPH